MLVVGLGPAGFTLAHHLMNDGHTVVAVDGLKIEPLPEALGGDALAAPEPVRDFERVYEQLDERVMAGFGGVAEYGITVRWNKNFLKIIRLLLERAREFAHFGGVRFGGHLVVDDAWDMGFDHIALCMGAGRPTLIPVKNGLARGVRQASDFLMALQLTGACEVVVLANLQVRLPVVVIGGGLTAIDTATERWPTTCVQVEKFAQRYRTLVRRGRRGACVAPASATTEDGDATSSSPTPRHSSRAGAAAAEGGQPELAKLLDSWGGVTVAYRRRWSTRRPTR